MAKEVKMHKFGQFIYVGGRKCRVCKAPVAHKPCSFCDYKGKENKFCDHPNGAGRCWETVPHDGYLKKL